MDSISVLAYGAPFPGPQRRKLRVATVPKVDPIVDIAIFGPGRDPLDQLLDCGMPFVASVLVVTTADLDAAGLRQLLATTRACAVIHSNAPVERWLPQIVSKIEAGIDWRTAIERWEESFRGGDDDEDEDDSRSFAGPDDEGTLESMPAARFVQAKVLTASPEADVVQTLEPAKDYQLNVRVAPPSRGWVTSPDSVPEPEWRPDETSRVLAVLFHEPNCCPDGMLQTIVLPSSGESTTAVFPFKAGATFDGRITIYDNNRPLIECGLRIGNGAMELRTLMRTRSFEADPKNCIAAAATLRIENETVHVVRGASKAAIPIEDYKTALQRLEKEVNEIALEKIQGSDFASNQAATALLIALANHGSLLHDQLTDARAMKSAYDAGGLLTVIAADSATRAPLELCYSLAAPASDARICPSAAQAAAQGKCVEHCDGSKDPEKHVCPMGFWGLQRCIEWRGLEADEAEEGAPPPPDPGRAPLQPLRQILYAHSARVRSLGRLPEVLELLDAEADTAEDWQEWNQKIAEKQPSMLLLMPHVDKKSPQPRMEIGDKLKDPAKVSPANVSASAVVLLLGCGAASFQVGYQSLPSQFRKNKAAVVVAPAAEILARDAPEIAATFLQQFRATPGAPLAEAILAAKRTLVANGVLSGLLLLSFGDADWRL